MKTREVIIISSGSVYGYEDGTISSIQSVTTDWSTITEEEYKLLKTYLRTINYNYHLVEKLDRSAVVTTVKRAVELAKVEKKRELKLRAKEKKKG